MVTNNNSSQQTGFHAPLEVADVHRVQSLLVLPTSCSSHARSSGTSMFSHAQTAAPQTQCPSRLAPIEMMTPSIHMVLKAGPPIIPKHSGGHGSVGMNDNGLQLLGSSSGAVGGRIMDCSRTMPPLWVIPVGYVLSAMWFSTCTLMAPGYLHVCGHTLCPAWTAVVLCHAMAFLVVWGDSTWACFGLLVALLFPCVVVMASTAVVTMYLLVFAGFASGYFWKTLHGAPFLAVCVCWFALLSGLILSLCVREHAMVQVGVIGLFALAVAAITSMYSLRKFTLLVTVSHGS